MNRPFYLCVPFSTKPWAKFGVAPRIYLRFMVNMTIGHDRSNEGVRIGGLYATGLSLLDLGHSRVLTLLQMGIVSFSFAWRISSNRNLACVIRQLTAAFHVA